MAQVRVRSPASAYQHLTSTAVRNLLSLCLVLVLQATADNNQQSALLHCLSSLGADTFAGVLLPKLVEADSAGAVALT